MIAIREVIKKYNLTANKSLGQNFLFDFNITNKIVRSAGDLSGSTVIEIGPGPGCLTQSILESNPKQLILVEKDKRFVKALKDYLQVKPEIIEEDALKFDYTKYKDIKIIANLPYNIGTTLILKFIDNISNFKSITVMLQKEVAERIVSKGGDKAYGRLSVISNIFCDCYKEFDLPPNAFIPPPKVHSSVITLIPKSNIDVDKKILKWLTHILFSKRRKTIRSILKNLIDEPENLGIDLNLRPENISIEEFITLTKDQKVIEAFSKT